MLNFSKGDVYMGRPTGTKNKMRTPEEKELIVQKYFNGESATDLTNEYNLSSKLIYRWIKKYEKNPLSMKEKILRS